MLKQENKGIVSGPDEQGRYRVETFEQGHETELVVPAPETRAGFVHERCRRGRRNKETYENHWCYHVDLVRIHLELTRIRESRGFRHEGAERIATEDSGPGSSKARLSAKNRGREAEQGVGVEADAQPDEARGEKEPTRVAKENSNGKRTKASKRRWSEAKNDFRQPPMTIALDVVLTTDGKTLAMKARDVPLATCVPLARDLAAQAWETAVGRDEVEARVRTRVAPKDSNRYWATLVFAELQAGPRPFSDLLKVINASHGANGSDGEDGSDGQGIAPAALSNARLTRDFQDAISQCGKAAGFTRAQVVVDQMAEDRRKTLWRLDAE